jgi:NTP pyrophosphatase (non-canonical NTP hydrolase)
MKSNIKYYIYHIPGRKVGVTTNLKNRVEKQQGYNPGEYEVLAKRTDIKEAAKYEALYQRLYGYPEDIVPYDKLNCNKNKTKKMQINATEQTSTFPCPADKLKGRLMDSMGMTWNTAHGNFHIDMDSISWIMKNIKTSMFNEERSYVYNKAFSRYYDNHVDGRLSNQGPPTDDGIFSLIRTWARERGIYAKGNSHTQYVKLQEEAGELAKALLKNDRPEIIDAIGDITVVLTNLAELEGMKIEDCIQSAYDVIAKRTGKMVNGTFVKTESL